MNYVLEQFPDTDADLQPPALFDRQPGESVSAFLLFDQYRALPNRSLTKLMAFRAGTEKGTKSHQACGYIRDLSRNWNWQKRAQAWDQHVASELRKIEVKALAEVRARHAAIARSMMEAGIQKMEQLLASDKEWSWEDCRKWITEGIRMERMVSAVDMANDAAVAPVTNIEQLPIEIRRNLYFKLTMPL